MAFTDLTNPLGVDDVQRIASAIQHRQARFGENFETSVGVVLMNYGDRLVHVRCVAGEWEGVKGDIPASNGLPLCPNGHPLLETSEAPRLALVPAGAVTIPQGEHDDRHLIQFRDAGWTIQHTLAERATGDLFDCALSNWTGGDPGVRGVFILNDDGTLGQPVDLFP